MTCPLRAMTGVPCPLCGMTTSVVEAVQLDFGDSLAASPGILFVAAAAAWRPRPVPTWMVVAVLAALWLFQLERFGLL